MPTYQLINPFIVGEFKRKVSAKTPLDAAEKVWTQIAGYITNDVPTFYFTLRQEGGSMHHFSVKEKRSVATDSESGEYRIEKYNPKTPKRLMDRFKQSISKVKTEEKQYGGGKKKGKKDKKEGDSSDYEDSTEEYEKWYKRYILSKPIVYWWYDPLIYVVDWFYVPTFVAPLTPYVRIDLGTAVL
jgi:hypothetical protein